MKFMYILAKKYKTKWSAKNCIGFLQRKNIYDALLYEFYMVNGRYCIQFKGLLKQFGGYMPDRDLYMDILAWHTVYILNFEENSDGTIVSVLVNAGEKENPHITHMNRYMMDKFFLKKLDATPLEC